MRYGWQLGLTILWLIELTMTAFMHNEDVALVFELLVEGKSTVIVKD